MIRDKRGLEIKVGDTLAVPLLARKDSLSLVALYDYDVNLTFFEVVYIAQDFSYFAAEDLDGEVKVFRPTCSVVECIDICAIVRAATE